MHFWEFFFFFFFFAATCELKYFILKMKSQFKYFLRSSLEWSLSNYHCILFKHLCHHLSILPEAFCGWENVMFCYTTHLGRHREVSLGTEYMCGHKLSVLSSVRLFLTSWTGAPLSREFSRQGYQNGVPFPTSGDPPNPGIEPMSPACRLHPLHCQTDSLLLSQLGSSTQYIGA